MSHTNRNPLIVLVALAAATAAPLAFAQDAKTDAATTEQSATQATTEAATATDASATAEQSTDATAQQSTDATAAKKQGWEEVDTDKDGNISKAEAGVNAGLAQVFDKADADTDGKLTPQEYKDFVAKNYGQKPQTTP